MYIHALTLSLFGKSIFVTRATSAAVSLLAAGSVALTLKKIFKARFWWVGIFLVGMMPAWLLHSRTAFETVMTTAFYGCFLLFYLLYRVKSPRYPVRGHRLRRHDLLYLFQRPAHHRGGGADALHLRFPLPPAPPGHLAAAAPCWRACWRCR